ncbi:hypothetical protein D3C87_1720740 [compost metagenome]
MQQAAPVQAGFFHDNLQPAFKAAGHGGHGRHRVGQIRVAENIGVVERAFAVQALGVDDQPAAFAEIQHVVVMHVAMQHGDLARVVQQGAGVAGALGQDAAVRLGHGPQVREPFLQAAQRGQRLGARGVQRLEYLAQNAGGFVVTAGAGIRRQ